MPEFEAQALEHLSSLMALAMRMTKSQAEAEDLVQDTYVKAMRAREQFSAGTNMRAWLVRIMTNTYINRYRRGGLERAVLEGPDADPLADGWIGTSTMQAMRDPESLALRPLLEQELKAALDELPPEFRAAVLLVDVEELSYKEVSSALGCPIGTVMSRLHRGRRMLKQRLLEQARALGLISPEPVVGKPDQAPVELSSYRARKASQS